MLLRSAAGAILVAVGACSQTTRTADCTLTTSLISGRACSAGDGTKAEDQTGSVPAGDPIRLGPAGPWKTAADAAAPSGTVPPPATSATGATAAPIPLAAPTTAAASGSGAVARPEVTAMLTKAEPTMTATVRAARPAVERAMASGPAFKGTLLLKEAVAIAVTSHPQIGAQASKLTGARADTDYARAAQRPQFDVSAGAGQSVLGTYKGQPGMFDSGGSPGDFRADVGFTFRQLIYDFGVARSEIQRNEAVIATEKLKLADTAEDIGLRTVNAYLNLLEQSELLSIINRTIADQRALADIVKLSEKGGNGTQADVARIQAKIIEIDALRLDIETAYKSAADDFHRLTGLDVRQVRRPASVVALIPKSAEEAMAGAVVTNPALLALQQNQKASQFQIAGIQAQRMPKIQLESDGTLKNYMGAGTSQQSLLDMRTMVTLNFKITDGGARKAQAAKAASMLKTDEFKYLDQKESIELDLRRFYQTLKANRAKRTAAVTGVETARKVNELYLEQFKAGKRTIFEVIDSNMSLFAMRRNEINGQFEELRAAYGILRALGRINETIEKT